MSPDQFLQAMKDRNEGFMQMYMRLLGHSLGAQSEMAMNGESPDVAVFAALFAEDRPLRLKKVLAQQLADTEEMLTSFGGEGGSVLISERNKAALKVLREQIAAGKKRLAIFYGAGHLADMDKRLREDFGLKPVEITWLTAWDLNPKP
jgi:pimeloyl-ACP methyl ester carboxylesterase